MRLFIYLMAGTAAMIAVMLFSGRYYHLPVWKGIVSAILLTAAGYAGAKVMAFVEMGTWDGRSFYGALFLAPCLMIPVALLLRIKIRELLDLCAPCECIMLALLKVDCVVSGCCYGIVLGRREVEDGFQAIRFPSKITECVAAMILMVVLILILKKKKNYGLIYPWYMVLYGASRFCLNLLRDTEPFVWILPAGNFWSLISITIGLIWMLVYKKWQKKNKTEINR
ncbi:MAG: hypothetical protein CW338_05795 [Clostridiales bacterium]|nr:hypothetical protein [Clostridiales bacterium]